MMRFPKILAIILITFAIWGFYLISSNLSLRSQISVVQQESNCRKETFQSAPKQREIKVAILNHWREFRWIPLHNFLKKGTIIHETNATNEICFEIYDFATIEEFYKVIKSNICLKFN
jgi:hypothetical protein